MTEWRWVNAALVYAVHDRQIAEHGGLAGVRDQGAVDAALDRPRNLAAYGSPDAADLAAAYAFGLLSNRGFADGNKRSAWVVARLFLADNSYRMTFDKLDAIRIIERTAAGSVSEAEQAEWFRRHMLGG